MMFRLVRTLLICLALLHATSASGMPAPAQNPSPTKNQSIPDPCGRFGKLFGAAIGIGAGLANSFEQDTLVHTRVLTDTGYQTRLKPIKDIAVGDEVLAWDELQAHDNAALAMAGQAQHTLQAAYQQRNAQNSLTSQNNAADVNLTSKSASNPSKCCSSSYENNSDGSIVNHASISAQRYEKVTDIASSFKEQTLLHLTLDNGQTIQATAGHPFKTSEGWRDAVMLKKGGKLLIKGGDADANSDAKANSDTNSAERYATITEIREEVKTTAVFNLEVANLHTFFVGVDGVVVHNAKNAGTYKEKSGGWDWAERVFERVVDTVIKDCGQTKVGKTRDGKFVNLHPSSSKHTNGVPTIEIRDTAGNTTSKHRY
jgi:Pretoxin HINT domain